MIDLSGYLIKWLFVEGMSGDRLNLYPMSPPTRKATRRSSVFDLDRSMPPQVDQMITKNTYFVFLDVSLALEVQGKIHKVSCLYVDGNQYGQVVQNLDKFSADLKFISFN